MLRTLFSLVAALFFSVTSVIAQDSQDDIVWVQLEAQPSLTVASERIRAYGEHMQDVNGFSLGGGWYAIALGPYLRRDADSVLRVYRSEGLIPIDAYLTTNTAYHSQFWPVGANLLNITAAQSAASEITSQVETATEDTQVASIAPTPVQLPEPTPEPVDETVREARASEATLTRDERKTLQKWLQWGGYYNAAIDGAFGRGTRGSMSAWQADNNIEPTGVLTTRQRATLRQQYFAILDGMDLQRVTNLDAGIEMQIPMGVVAKEVTEYPFVQFDATSQIPAQVLMISQAGDQNTLFGLYDIMQTLEIVPLVGPRERKKNRFSLIGENTQIVSHTEVTLKDGTLKGFTLVWPAGDEERRTRILGEMQASFARIEGVLDPAAGNNPAQDIDLMAGLQVRKPKMARSGFFIDGSGRVITTAQAVESCTKVTIEADYEMDITVLDTALGVAILSPRSKLAPQSVATLREGAPRLKSEIAVAGYSYEGVLGAPTMTFGQLADIKGLRGERELTRLALAPQPGDAGGPVFDTAGSVFGMLLPRETDTTQQLPGDVNFAVNADAIRALLAQEGITATVSEGGIALAPEDLSKQASAMTVLVSCW